MQAPPLKTIQELLGPRTDDTSRFVGLALLKSVLDDSPALRADETVVSALWESIPPHFLDRLLRTGVARLAGPQTAGEEEKKEDEDEASHMLDLAVSVLHTFSTLLPLPRQARREPKFVQRIPAMLPCLLLLRSQDTTRRLLETLLSLVGSADGAAVLLLEAHDRHLGPLVDLAPSHPLALQVLHHAWVSISLADDDETQNTPPGRVADLSAKLDQTVQTLLSTFRQSTDPVPLLAFVDNVLRSVHPRILAPNPPWLDPLTRIIHNIFSDNSIRRVFTDPPTAVRCGPYTNLAAALLQAYPVQMPRLLFSAETKSEKPFAYLFPTLLLVDLRSSLPTLLEPLNSPSYASTSRRLASAFDVLSSFLGHLVRSMDDDDDDDDNNNNNNNNAAAASLPMSPDLLLRLRRAISETAAVAMQHLRDRWDAATAHTSTGSRLTVAWDSIDAAAAAAAAGVRADPLVLAALRTLALWLRDDGNATLGRDAAGLMDMFLVLYRASAGGPAAPDFRPAVLVALEGVLAHEHNVPVFLAHGGWQVLAEDVLAVLQAGSPAPEQDHVPRATEAVSLLLSVARAEQAGTGEACLDLVTRLAAWDLPDEDVADPASAAVMDLYVAVLELVTVLLERAPAPVRRRYAHSRTEVERMARQLRIRIRGDSALSTALEETTHILTNLT
ncbi:hypothetical protein P8C59_005135 [Phyllachora maydis]|uniref:Uncharacterized protein n=1 Tax=Phyllachora maydis TaxID=1825666 RepID=A0AAD9I3U2_9PEZI|nr:hypothetical protein P8C59_005135 [Phyllachora maydis]